MDERVYELLNDQINKELYSCLLYTSRRGGRRVVKIEWLIAFYLFISVMMTVFNFGYLAYEKVHAKRFDARTKRFAVLLGQEIERNAEFPTEDHKRTLERAMRRMAGMESFDLTMGHLLREDPDKSERYLHGIATVFDISRTSSRKRTTCTAPTLLTS